MKKTIPIIDRECMVPFPGSTSSPVINIRGQTVNTRIIPSENSLVVDVPRHLQEALVGLTISSVLTKEQINRSGIGGKFDHIIPPRGRLAFVEEIAEVLCSADQNDDAKELLATLPGELTMYVFPENCFEVIEQ